MLRGIHSQVFTRFEQNQNFNPDLIPSHASINPDQYIERNFLSTLFSIEARYLPNKQIFLASQIPSQAIIEIQRSLMSAKQVGIFLSNQDRLRILYSTFRAMGYRIGRDSNGGFLTLNLLDADVQARGMLSCRFSLLAYGIAQELGWNVTVRRARNHIYLHWKDEHGNPFNMDVAIVNPAAPVRERYSVTRSFQDPFYIRHYELPSETIGLDAIYLRDLTEQELISEVYDSIGFEMARSRRDYDQALECYNQALGLDPRNVQARYHRAIVYYRAGRLDEAMADCQRILGIYPGYPGVTNLISSIQVLQPNR